MQKCNDGIRQVNKINGDGIAMSQQQKQDEKQKGLGTGAMLGIATYLIGAGVAATLSWKCNTNHGYGTPAKILFGGFAGLGSWSYCMQYLFLKSGTCSITQEKCQLAGFGKAQ